MADVSQREWDKLHAEIERLRAALNDVATMSFSTKPAGMSELEWTVCNLRTLQLYAGEALIANEQQTVVPSADDAVVLHPPSSVMWSDLYLATDNARLPPEGSASDASEQQAPAKQVGMDWELSDEAKQQLAEIDKHIKR